MTSEIVMVKEEYQSDDSENCQVKMKTEHSSFDPQDIRNNVDFSSQMCVKEEAKSLMIEIKEEAGCPAEVKAEPDEWDIDIEEKEISNDQESCSETLQLSSVGMSDQGYKLEMEVEGYGAVARLKQEVDMDAQSKFDKTALNTAGDLLVPQMILIQDQLMKKEDRLYRNCSVKLERLDADSQVNLQPAKDEKLICDHCGFAAKQKGCLVRHITTHASDQPFTCSDCDFKCSAPRDFMVHQRKHTGEKPYKCSYCGFSSSLKENLRLHLMKHTKEKPYKCSECGFPFRRKGHLLRHQKTHTDAKPFACDQCSFRCREKENLKVHINVHTREKSFKCSECNFSCLWRSSLERHQLVHANDESIKNSSQFKCGTCDYKCTQKVHLVNHMATIHPYKCNHCNYTSPKKGNLKRHELTHAAGTSNDDNTNLFACDICSCKYKRKSDLQDHIRTHSGEKPFKCNHCDFATHIKRNLKRHQSRHTTGDINCKNTNVFESDICSYKYKRKSDLTNDLKIHTGPFKCSYCNYATNIRTNLKEHELKHYTGEMFGCHICSSKYKWKSDLRKHMKIHEGLSKPLKCSHCDYVTLRKRNLKRHEVRHTIGETSDSNTNVFECDICSRKFVWKSELRDHMTTHSGEKLFKCNYCDYSGKKQTYLTAHLLQHTGEKPYKCSYCDYASPIKKYLKGHELGHRVTRETNDENGLFGCDICCCKYKWKSDLRKHMRKHTGEKPFKCSLCDFATHLKRNLKEHDLKHTSGELLRCDICSRKYKWKSNLREHMKLHSGEQPLKCNHCDYTTYTHRNLRRHRLRLGHITG